jgi:hypothetical protein
MKLYIVSKKIEKWLIVRLWYAWRCQEGERLYRAGNPRPL